MKVKAKKSQIGEDREEEERVMEGRERSESCRDICLTVSLLFLFSELEFSH